MQLAGGELVHAIRRGALLDEGEAARPTGGTLYLTSERLVHAGEQAARSG